MGDLKTLLWFLTLVMFIVKLLADYYTARFKWIQAAQSRRTRNQDCSVEDSVVSHLSSPESWGISASITLLTLVALFITTKPDYHFPLLSFVTITWFAGISSIGAAGDWRREISLRNNSN